jgi:hypothetical protein
VNIFADGQLSIKLTFFSQMKDVISISYALQLKKRAGLCHQLLGVRDNIYGITHSNIPF